MVKPPPAYPVPAVRPIPPVVIAEKVVATLRAKPTETHVRRIDERPARFGEWPEGADERLTAVLRKRGIERPFVHQAAAIGNALAGKNTVVVTPTASGKTLCYNAPVLSAILKDPTTRALYLFPTKALAQDQLDELHGLVTDLQADIRTFTYDGDTPADARRAVRQAGHIVLTNPDMLHAAILPHHTKWMQLFESLQYVVIDEVHSYRGVFGSHLANVLRRLRRICQFYGADPTFILCSATIANPGELAAALVGDDVELIDDNGAPSGERVVVIHNPPVVNRELGIRQSSLKAARDISAELIRSGIQTIVFAPSRTRVELLLTYLRDSLRNKPGDPERVTGYRGGYLPNERRAVEKGLRDGTVRGVVATNALELGIDIGGLGASVVTGYPGSLASLWQQFGRAGRSREAALSVLVASSNPLDQFVATHPDFVFEGAVERGLIDPDNLFVMASHVKCAAFELPFTVGEVFGANTDELLDILAEDGVIQKANNRYHWMSEAYPAEQVSLRTASTDNFVIIEQGPHPRVIGECDRPSAPLLIHEDAIYIHRGQQYQVEYLDWDDKKAFVTPVAVDYYTDAQLAVELKVLDSFHSEGAAAGRHDMGEVAITFLATIFKKIKLNTHENVGWGKIAIPEANVHTTSYWLTFDEKATNGLDREQIASGLSGIGELARNLAAIFCLCDARDIGANVQVRAPSTELPTVYLYDMVPGGVGLAEKLFEVHDRLLEACLALVKVCECETGCPGCVGPQVEPASPAKRAAALLLERVLGV
ncbi:DEAD/DEAH box helicase [Candidatus Amarobacter glycogenicus]|uniref:DEAD/DEAH box helicase n=1 Tax=Candidatus Amarobacter glycogenicus TaxID=3140699 RepID=UPI00313711E5|nr:DEAD/DEAH box helicase [Dehalococcoidia bacterium]